MRAISKVMLSMLILLCYSNIVHAGNQVPYKDSVIGEIISEEMISPNTLCLGFSATGQGTQLGRFTTLGELVVDTNTLSFTGTNTITAANGDMIFLDIVDGQLTATSDPEVFIIELTTVFTGGTGRFDEVSGGFDGVGTFILSGDNGFVGSSFRGKGLGTISSPGSLKKN